MPHNDNPIKILVAEDSPTQAEQICASLEKRGYRVLLARDGNEALEKASKEPPTLIISDVLMPGLNGYELCRRVKSDVNLRDTPVMLLTSLSDPADVIHGLECGADNFLVKPYNEQYLGSRIAFMLANRNVRDSDSARMGVEIVFGGTKYFITSDRLQILNLLLSTYETAVQKNEELATAQNELRELADSLEERVQQRTIELQAEIIERRRTEAALIESNQALVTSQNAEIATKKQLERLLNASPAMIYSRAPGPPYNVTFVSDNVADRLGYEPLLLLNNEFWNSRIHPDDKEDVVDSVARLQRGEPLTLLYRFRRADEVYCWLRDELTLLCDEAGNPSEIAGFWMDVTKQHQAEESVRRQLLRLSSLRTIDAAITGGLDLRVTLSLFLEQVAGQLGVEAANVFIMNPVQQRLQLVATHGFDSRRTPEISLGEGLPGRAALQKLTLHSVEAESTAVSRNEQALLGVLEKVHYATPLTIKGEVKGVLEVYSSQYLNIDQEWIDFYETLATQGAIAIDSAQMFDGLRQANLELTMAYEATLQGWVQALDLRDRETEHHTKRVTEITLRLASALGIPEHEGEHMRRGALLHDIGKMGIPDEILHKPGPLTEDEWTIMKRHPEYARGFLSEILYLRPALDIPYRHHEKWDGTGYPSGLRGEEIPLAARVFAIADVWDALTSDRPYRAAWPTQQVRQHIQEQAGKHFDPDLVKLFLEMPAETFDVSSAVCDAPW